MSIAILLATRNGARTLPQVLAAHAALRPAGTPHRLVVVDNGSTDATPSILAHAAAQHPGLDLVPLHEPQPGKNRALNRAMPLAAAAALAVFTDDDAVPEPDWLQRLAAGAAAASGHAIFGGAIRPRWMAPPPSWLFRWQVPLDVCFALNDGAPGPVPAARVWGPNMAVRGAVLRQGFRFDTGIGPDGRAAYPMGSEVEFTRRLERAGHRAWFVPDAVVHHLVRPEQLDEAWVLRRAYRCGLGAARLGSEACWRGRLPLGLAEKRRLYGAASRLARRMLPPCRLRFWCCWQAELLRGLADGGAMSPRAVERAQAEATG